MEIFKLEILTPNGVIYNGSAVSVTLPGEEGEFGVLAHHATITTLLQPGVIEIEKEDKTVESVCVDWGVVKVSDASVTVLVDGAVIIAGTTESEVAAAIADAKQLVNSVSDSAAIIASVSAKIETAAQKL
jgi:F-type H+-transporting ATPase subunit epsilon